MTAPSPNAPHPASLSKLLEDIDILLGQQHEQQSAFSQLQQQHKSINTRGGGVGDRHDPSPPNTGAALIPSPNQTTLQPREETSRAQDSDENFNPSVTDSMNFLLQVPSPQITFAEEQSFVAQAPPPQPPQAAVSIPVSRPLTIQQLQQQIQLLKHQQISLMMMDLLDSGTNLPSTPTPGGSAPPCLPVRDQRHQAQSIPPIVPQAIPNSIQRPTPKVVVDPDRFDPREDAPQEIFQNNTNDRPSHSVNFMLSSIKMEDSEQMALPTTGRQETQSLSALYQFQKSDAVPPCFIPHQGAPAAPVVDSARPPTAGSTVPPPAQEATKVVLDKESILRPLSAYNFFFSDEREKILKGDPNSVVVETSNERKRRLLAQHLKKDRTKRRPHRKTHGKINFTSLSKLIGQRWRELPASEKQFYKDVAAADLERYHQQLAEANKNAN